MSTIEVAAQRLNRIAWGLALAAAGLVAVRCAQGYWPDRAIDCPFNGHKVAQLDLWWAIALTIFALIAVIEGPAALLWLCGRPWKSRAEAKCSLPVSPVEADEREDRACATLIGLGYRIGRRQPLPDGGWTTEARRENTWNDPRRRLAFIDFRYERGVLTIAARSRPRESENVGERDAAQWFIDSLADGCSVERPPKFIDQGALLWLAASLAGALVSAALHVVPEGARSPAAAMGLAGLALLMGAVGVLVTITALRWTVAKSVWLPAAVLCASAVALLQSRPAAWQTLPWRATNDPCVLWRALASVQRDLVMQRARILSRHDERAIDAQREIAQRLIALGPRAAAALAQVDDEKFARPARYLFYEMESAYLVAALEVPDAPTRAGVLEALIYVDREAAARVAVPRFRDPDAGVRRVALRVFESKDAPWNDALADEIASLLADRDPAVRHAAAIVLGLRRHHPAGAALLARWHVEPCLGVRKSLIVALGMIAYAPSLPTIAALAGRGDDYASHALFNMGGPGVEALLGLADRPELHPVLLGEPDRDLTFSEAGLARLHAMLDGTDRERRSVALWFLAHASDERALSRAAAELRSEDGWRILWPLRDRGYVSGADAAWWIERGEPRSWRQFGPKDADLAPAFAGVASDARYAMPFRLRTLRTLAQVAPDQARAVAERMLEEPHGREVGIFQYLSTEHLLRLMTDRESRIRVAATCTVLGRPDVSPETVLRFLGDTDRSIQSSAVRAAGRLRLTRAADRIIALASQGDTFDAVRALGEIGDARALPILRRVLWRAWIARDVDEYYLAASALVACGDRRHVQTVWHVLASPLQGFDSDFALRAIARLGDEGVALLLKLPAYEYVGYTNSAHAFEPLVAKLRGTTLSWAARGLGHLRDPRAVPHLVRALEQPRCEAGAIAWALQEITGERFGLERPYDEATPAVLARVRAWAARRP